MTRWCRVQLAVGCVDVRPSVLKDSNFREREREREIVMLNQIGITESDQVSKMHGCVWSKREE